MPRAEQASISNLALALIGLFACATLGTLGTLVYKVRTRHSVASASPVRQEPNLKSPASSSESENYETFRVAARTPAAVSEVTPDEPAAPIPETPAAEVEAPKIEPSPIKIADAQGNLTPVQPAVNDDLIGEITGMSYTTKKLLASGMDPNNPAKPDPKAARKPEPKKPAIAIVPPKTPVKPEPPKLPAKPAAPALPPLPTMGDGQLDVSKFPIYVLNDGRRIRALISRELNGMVSVRNEAGTEISFKKTDVKEVIKK